MATLDREAGIQALCRAGDFAGAATEALRLLGPELLGYLVAIHRDPDEADDAFAALGERLWRGLPRFSWECSLRTWAYRVARSASVDVIRARGAVARRAERLSGCPEVDAMAARVRSETSLHRRTTARDAVAELRRSLPEEDQTVLILRLDRKLGWDEIAHVFLDARATADAGALRRESARLRKRFQLARDRLLELGRRRGLLPAKEA